MARPWVHVLRPWADFMSLDPSLEISLLIPAKNSAHALEQTVQEAMRFFEPRYPNQYEIILIPNPSDPTDSTPALAEALARKTSVIRVIPHLDLAGKGAALRTGLSGARGHLIFFTDADLPYELEFFDRAILKLQQGYDLVTGNRRLLNSHFNIPVELLPVAYGRHRLGLAFNHVVRFFFPVRTTDTQAGIKAMSRRLARKAFSRMECPGFFFDLEIFLTAQAHQMKQAELPVNLHLHTEKSTVRLVRDGILAAYWLSRIFLRLHQGAYS